MSQLHLHFAEAVAAIDHGNLDRLKELIKAEPALVRMTNDSAEEPYAGYFHKATLLHHVAFNPHRNEEIPANIVEIAEFLLGSGADPNAICGGGPTQPGTDHGTIIGLIVSGSQAINKGFARQLVETLVKHGAELEYGETGVNLFGAIYHTVENKRQKEAARILYDLGHDIDMVFAAGLGLLHSVKGYIHPDGYLKEDADRLFSHHRRDGNKKATDREVLQDCLLAASINNELEVIKFLLSLELDVNLYRKWGPWSVTPLHGAAWAGWLEASELLIEHGASTMLHDPEHNSTPIGWAHYCGRTELFEWFNQNDQYFNLFDAIEFGKFERFKVLFDDQDPDMAIGGGSRGVLLRIAADQGQVALTKFLLEKGADPQLENAQGKRAIDWARAGGHTEVVKLLEL
ncbi:MAG: hypothetical protein HEP71_26290 [Roseivirga sp.]|nr:hypothetical protein [Roseivirga sp.]